MGNKSNFVGCARQVRIRSIRGRAKAAGENEEHGNGEGIRCIRLAAHNKIIYWSIHKYVTYDEIFRCSAMPFSGVPDEMVAAWVAVCHLGKSGQMKGMEFFSDRNENSKSECLIESDNDRDYD